MSNDKSGILPRLLTPTQTGSLIGGEEEPITSRTLANWRCSGKYPELRWVKAGRYVRYRLEDVLAFIELRTRGGAEVSQ